MSAKLSYQYVTLRCMPRVDREEFLNLGVALYCEAADYLQIAYAIDPVRLRALDPRLDVAALSAGLDYLAAVCAGDPAVGAAGAGPAGSRFGFVRAPRSTVLQPGPVHGGLTADPARELDRLLHQLVG